MKWQDQGIVLSAKRHGENSWILSLLTQDHGRHAGIARISKKNQILLQMGNLVQASWTARLPEHLGMWQLELISSPLARLMTDPLKLTGLTSIIHLLDHILPERNPYSHIYESLETFIENLSTEAGNNHDQTQWLRAYVRFELMLLEQLGYGLDLRTCAATGQSDNLTYVSPKTGRAVCQESGIPYHDRLLRLPPFLKNTPDESPFKLPDFTSDLKDGLKMTGHFLGVHFFPKGLPESRFRLLTSLG